MTRTLGPILREHFLKSQVRMLKPREAVTVPSGSSLHSAVQLLVEQNIGSLLVADAPGELQGILTERDILMKAGGRERKFDQIQVGEIMTAAPQSLPPHASIARVLHTMSAGHFRHVPIVGTPDGKPRIISVKDVVAFLYERIAHRVVNTIDQEIVDPSATAQFFADTIEILQPHEVRSVDEKCKVQEAVAVLREERLGSVLVMSHGRKLVGIFTERDFLKRVALALLPVWRGPISNVMTAQPQTLLTTATCSLAFEKMADGGFRHIPVMNEMEKVVGIISVRNVVDFLVGTVLSELTA